MGNGMSGSSRDLNGSGGRNVNVVSEMDVWSYRHNANNAPFVDSINDSIRTMQNDFPDMMQDINSVNAAKLGGRDNNGTLGFYTPATKELSMNQNFTDIDKMNAVMGQERGFHPPRGSKNGVEAVTLHEAGHALTDSLAKKIGAADIDDSAKRIVQAAYKATGARGGTKKWAGGISGYAQHSYAECVAEAVADWYCNGSKAAKQSKAIMTEMKRIQAL